MQNVRWLSLSLGWSDHHQQHVFLSLRHQTTVARLIVSIQKVILHRMLTDCVHFVLLCLA